jgi:hypothetical protein
MKTFIIYEGKAEIATLNKKEAPNNFLNRYNLMNTEAQYIRWQSLLL